MQRCIAAYFFSDRIFYGDWWGNTKEAGWKFAVGHLLSDGASPCTRTFSGWPPLFSGHLTGLWPYSLVGWLSLQPVVSFLSLVTSFLSGGRGRATAYRRMAVGWEPEWRINGFWYDALYIIYMYRRVVRYDENDIWTPALGVKYKSGNSFVRHVCRHERMRMPIADCRLPCADAETRRTCNLLWFKMLYFRFEKICEKVRK